MFAEIVNENSQAAIGVSNGDRWCRNWLTGPPGAIRKPAEVRISECEYVFIVVLNVHSSAQVDLANAVWCD